MAGMLQQHAAAQAELVRSVLQAEVEERLGLWQGVVVRLGTALPDHRHNQAHPENGLDALSHKRSFWWCIREKATVQVGRWKCQQVRGCVDDGSASLCIS